LAKFTRWSNVDLQNSQRNLLGTYVSLFDNTIVTKEVHVGGKINTYSAAPLPINRIEDKLSFLGIQGVDMSPFRAKQWYAPGDRRRLLLSEKGTPQDAVEPKLLMSGCHVNNDVNKIVCEDNDCIEETDSNTQFSGSTIAIIVAGFDRKAMQCKLQKPDN